LRRDVLDQAAQPGAEDDADARLAGPSPPDGPRCFLDLVVQFEHGASSVVKKARKSASGNCTMTRAVWLRTADYRSRTTDHGRHPDPPVPGGGSGVKEGADRRGPPGVPAKNVVPRPETQSQ